MVKPGNIENGEDSKELKWIKEQVKELNREDAKEWIKEQLKVKPGNIENGEDAKEWIKENTGALKKYITSVKEDPDQVADIISKAKHFAPGAQYYEAAKTISNSVSSEDKEKVGQRIKKYSDGARKWIKENKE